MNKLIRVLMTSLAVHQKWRAAREPIKVTKIPDKRQRIMMIAEPSHLTMVKRTPVVSLPSPKLIARSVSPAPKGIKPRGEEGRSGKDLVMSDEQLEVLPEDEGDPRQ